MMKPLRLWGGFVDGKLECDGVVNFYYEYLGERGELIRRPTSAAIYSSRKEARRQYEDVRRIEIREVKP